MFWGMLSISECKRILKRSGVVYSDEDIELIRQLLHVLAVVDLEVLSLRNKGNEADSNIYTGFNR